MTAKKTSSKKSTTKKTSSQKKQPAKTKASGKAEHPVKKQVAATFQSDEFKERMRQIASERGGFKRLAAKDLNKMSDAHRRSVLIKRAYHAARKECVANPYEHARAVVEKQLAAPAEVRLISALPPNPAKSGTDSTIPIQPTIFVSHRATTE